MKKIFLIVFLLGILFYKYDAKAQIDCYNLGNCENVQWTSTWMGVVYPPFPTCTLTVEVKTRVCNGKTQVQVAGIYFYDPFSDCDAIVAWLWPNGWQQGQSPDQLRSRQLFDYVYENVIPSIFEEATKNMKDLFPCDNNPATPELAEYTYYKQACQALCYAIYQHSTNPSLRYLYLALRKCTDECCQVILKYCWLNGVLTQRERIVIPPVNQPECSTIPPPPCNYPAGNIIYQGVTDCFSQPCQ